MKQAYLNLVKITVYSREFWLLSLSLGICLCLITFPLYKILHQKNAALTYGDIFMLFFVFGLIAISIQASCYSICISRFSFTVPDLYRTTVNFTLACLIIFSILFSSFNIIILKTYIGVSIALGAKLFIAIVPLCIFIILLAYFLTFKFPALTQIIVIILILSSDYFTKGMHKTPVPQIGLAVSISIFVFSLIGSCFLLKKLRLRNTYVNAILLTERESRFNILPASLFNLSPTWVEKYLASAVRRLDTTGLPRKAMMLFHFTFFAFKGNSVIAKPIIWLAPVILILIVLIGFLLGLSDSMNSRDLPILDLAPAIIAICFGTAMFGNTLDASRLVFLGRREKYVTFLTASVLSTFESLILMAAIIGLSMLACIAIPGLEYNGHSYHFRPLSFEFFHIPLMLPLVFILGMMEKDKHHLWFLYLISILVFLVLFCINYSPGLAIASSLFGWFIFWGVLKERFSGDLVSGI